MDSKKILISCPVRNRDWILPYYLRNLYNLNYDKSLISIYWLVNNNTDNSLKLLEEFKNEHKNEYANIEIEVLDASFMPEDDRATNRQKYIYYHLSNLRNKIIEKAKGMDIDYLYSSDCDILMSKDTLTKLLSHNKDVVAALLYNGHHVGPQAETKNVSVVLPQNNLGIKISISDSKVVKNSISSNSKNNDYAAQMYPNILNKTIKGIYKHIYNYNTNNKIGLIECDFTGASILISKKVCEFAKYAPDVIYGEDLPFCRCVQAKGYKLYCDCSAYVEHIQGIEFLEKYKDFK